MRLAQFTEKMKTTKDTVRHYEDLNLLVPEWNGARKNYQEKEVMDFQAITEMKQLGLTLKDISLIFQLKRSLGCGSPSLTEEVSHQLSAHLAKVKEEERQIQKRRLQLENIITELEAVK